MINISEIEIVYKSKADVSKLPKIQSSRDAEKILRTFFQEFIEHREGMYCLYLNRCNRAIACYQIGLGGVSGVVVDSKLIFQGALKTNASGIILAHNHPSGNSVPSQADLDLTRKVKQGGQLLDISMLDHLILLPTEGYYSFADEGTL